MGTTIAWESREVWELSCPAESEDLGVFPPLYQHPPNSTLSSLCTCELCGWSVSYILLLLSPLYAFLHFTFPTVTCLFCFSPHLRLETGSSWRSSELPLRFLLFPGNLQFRCGARTWSLRNNWWVRHGASAGVLHSDGGGFGHAWWRLRSDASVPNQFVLATDSRQDDWQLTSTV